MIVYPLSESSAFEKICIDYITARGKNQASSVIFQGYFNFARTSGRVLRILFVFRQDTLQALEISGDMGYNYSDTHEKHMKETRI